MTRRHCVVLAGGLGTRLRDVTKGSVPKVLVPVLGQPFLHYKLKSLREMGVDEVTLLVGELGHLVDEYVSARESDELVCNVVHDGPVLLGTAGSIARALPHLPEVFWVTYGDTYVWAELRKAEVEMADRGLSAVMTVLHNSDDLQTSNVRVQSGLVTDYHKDGPPGTFAWIDYGLLYMRREEFRHLQNDQSSDLHTVLTNLIKKRQLMAYEVTDRFWDVGTPEALHQTENEFLRRGLR